RAVAAAEDLVREFPDIPLYRDQVVDAGNRLAYAIVNTHPEEAEGILRRNLTLTKDTPTFSHRALTYRNLGVLLAKQHRFSEAEDACSQGVVYFEKSLGKPPSRLMQVELAGALKQLAKIVETNGRPEEAERICRRSLPLFDKFA